MPRNDGTLAFVHPDQARVAGKEDSRVHAPGLDLQNPSA